MLWSCPPKLVWGSVKLKLETQIVGFLPGPADVANIPCNPVKRLCSPLFGLEEKISSLSKNVYQRTCPCAPLPSSSSTPWSGRSPLQACTIKNFGFPIRFGQFLVLKTVLQELVECWTCCWRTRKYIPCWSTARLMHKPPHLCHDWRKKRYHKYNNYTTVRLANIML